MFESVNVIGRGRVGSAIAARLEERGVELRDDDAELILLCVPDRAIAESRGDSSRGRWIAHVSGATPLAALDPHERRFSLHPLQTFTRSRGPEQLDGAWAAVTAETDEARGQALSSRGRSACGRSSSPTRTGRSTTPARRSPRPSWSRSTAPPRRCVERRRCAAGGARAAHAPHDRERLRADRPDRARRLGDRRGAPARRSARRGPSSSRSTTRLRRRRRAMKIVRTIAELRAALGRAERRDRARADDGRASTGPPRALPAARARVRHRRREPVRQPGPVRPGRGPRRLPARRGARRRARREAGVDLLFAPAAEEMYPPGFQTWVEVERSPRCWRASTGPATSAASRPSA